MYIHGVEVVARQRGGYGPTPKSAKQRLTAGLRGWAGTPPATAGTRPRNSRRRSHLDAVPCLPAVTELACVRACMKQAKACRGGVDPDRSRVDSLPEAQKLGATQARWTSTRGWALRTHWVLRMLGVARGCDAASASPRRARWRGDACLVACRVSEGAREKDFQRRRVAVSRRRERATLPCRSGATATTPCIKHLDAAGAKQAGRRQVCCVLCSCSLPRKSGYRPVGVDLSGVEAKHAIYHEPGAPVKLRLLHLCSMPHAACMHAGDCVACALTGLTVLRRPLYMHLLHLLVLQVASSHARARTRAIRRSCAWRGAHRRLWRRHAGIPVGAFHGDWRLEIAGQLRQRRDGQRWRGKRAGVSLMSARGDFDYFHCAAAASASASGAQIGTTCSASSYAAMCTTRRCRHALLAVAGGAATQNPE